MIRVLHLFTTLDGGGVESFLYNYYSHMDSAKIEFDAVVPGDTVGYLEPIFVDLGSKVFHVKRFRENPYRHIDSVAKIIKNGQYDVVHCHGYKSTIGLIFAKIFGCKVRIIHSHMAYVNENIISKICRKITTFIAEKCATEKFACGIDAAKWLFGTNAYEKGEVRVIDNAIDLAKYAFNEEVRNNYRKQMNLTEKFVIGNVARLTYQKNQSFLLHILKEMLLINPSVMLLLIGEGEDKEKLENECLELDIQENVKFLGLRKDIPELLSTMDFFVLPSRYEGLPVVLAEIQAAGLPACVSESITKEINVTKRIHYISLESSYNKWSETISELAKRDSIKKRYEAQKIMINGKYDISYQAKKLFDIYSMLLKK